MTAHPDGTGLVAVVTGAGGGLGGAIARRLAARGCTVVRTDVRLTDAVDRRLDVTDATACRALADELDPDIWVNNAGILGAGDAATQPDDEVAAVVAVNLLGVVNGTRAAFGAMARRGRGQILNIGSLASWTAVPGETLYAATKAGVLSFTVGFAAEHADRGVRLAVLCPDGIWSPMLEDRLDDPSAAMSFTGSRLLTTDEVADEAMALLDSGALVRSVPRTRGVQTRLFGIAPSFALRLHRVLEAVGRRSQRRLQAERHRHHGGAAPTPGDTV